MTTITPVQPSNFTVVPVDEKNQPIFKKVEVIEYTIDVKKITDLFALKKNEIEEFLKALNMKFKEIEAENPAAGYRLYITGGLGNNPLEVTIKSYGTREKNTPIEFATPPKGCAFCPKVEKNEQMSPYEQDEKKGVKVIQTLQDNALVISDDHEPNFFNLPLDTQIQMLLTQKEVLYTHKKNAALALNKKVEEDRIVTSYTLRYHIGVHGHQKMPHAHGHIDTGTN